MAVRMGQGSGQRFMSHLKVEVFWKVDIPTRDGSVHSSWTSSCHLVECFPRQSWKYMFPFSKRNLFFFLSLSSQSLSLFFFFPTCVKEGAAVFQELISFEEMSRQRLIWKERPGSVLKDIPCLQVELAVAPRSSEPSREVPVPLWGRFVAGELAIQLQVEPQPFRYGAWSPLLLAPDPGLSLRTLILKPFIH